LYLDDAVAGAVDAARARAGQRRVFVEVGAFEEARITGDAALVRQLLLIVLDNALKFTPAGGRVRLDVSAQNGRAAVVVTDTGLGSGRCISLPAPIPSASGSRPNRVHSVVIRMGRSRTRAASRIAASSAVPSARIRSRVKSNRMMPFLTISPTSRIRPMNEETLSGVPVRNSSARAPTNETGATSNTTRGSTKDSNCTTITAQTLTAASASTS